MTCAAVDIVTGVDHYAVVKDDGDDRNMSGGSRVTPLVQYLAVAGLLLGCADSNAGDAPPREPDAQAVGQAAETVLAASPDKHQKVARAVVSVTGNRSHNELVHEVEVLRASATRDELAGRFTAARDTHRRILDIHKRTFGADNWRTRDAGVALSRLTTYCELGNDNRDEVIRMRQLLDQATALIGPERRLEGIIPLATEAGTIAARLLGTDSLDYTDSSLLLAGAFSENGELARAITLQKQVVESKRRLYGDYHPKYFQNLVNYCGYLREFGSVREAEKWLSGILKEVQPDGSEEIDIALTAAKLGRANIAWYDGDHETCTKLLEEIIDSPSRLSGTSWLRTQKQTYLVHALAKLAYVQIETGRKESGEIALRRAEEIVEGDGYGSVMGRIRVHCLRAEACRRSGLVKIGVEYLELAHDELVRMEKDNSLNVLYVHLLARMHASQGHAVEAEAHYRDAIDRLERKFGADNPGRVILLVELAEFFRNAGQDEEAVECDRIALDCAHRLNLRNMPTAINYNKWE
jgi:tetratricopeptide (TPR) repeat protein